MYRRIRDQLGGVTIVSSFVEYMRYVLFITKGAHLKDSASTKLEEQHHFNCRVVKQGTGLGVATFERTGLLF